MRELIFFTVGRYTYAVKRWETYNPRRPKWGVRKLNRHGHILGEWKTPSAKTAVALAELMAKNQATLDARAGRAAGSGEG
jgi:hypothetical protein